MNASADAALLAEIARIVVAQLVDGDVVSVAKAVATAAPQLPGGTTTAEIVLAIVREAELRGLVILFDRHDG